MGKAGHLGHLAIDGVVTVFASLSLATLLFLLTAPPLLGLTSTSDWRPYAIIAVLVALCGGYLLKLRALGAKKMAAIMIVLSAVFFVGAVFLVGLAFSLWAGE